MKAIQLHAYGGVDQLHYEDVPVPKPGPDDVLVKVAATSVNPVDWKIREGQMKQGMPLSFPAILGRDLAGEVVEAGSNVSKWKAGQRVMGLVSRSYAEFVAANAGVLAPIPDGLDFEQAGVLPLVTTTGAQLMERIHPQRGSTVLVTGALGSVGRTAVYAAKRSGARVIAGVRAKQKKAAESLKADQIVAIDSDEEIQSLPQLNAIADTVNGAVIGKLIPKLKRGGVLGSVLGRPQAAEGKDIRVEPVLSHPDPELLREMAEAVRNHELDIPVAREFKLSDAAQAQALLQSGTVDGKIALVP